MPVPTAPVAAAGLLSGFAVARYTGRRELGGAAFAAAGPLCARSWQRTCGTARAPAFTGAYTAATGASHPLATKIGAWPSVAVTASAVSAAAYVGANRPAVLR